MERLISLVDKHKQLILDAERYIWKTPKRVIKKLRLLNILQKSLLNLVTS